MSGTEALFWAVAVLTAIVVGVILKLAIDAKGENDEDRRLGLNETDKLDARGFEPVIKQKENDHG